LSDLNKLLVKEIAEVLGVDRRSISRWVRDENLPKNSDGTFDAGRCVGWLLNRLEERLEQQAEEGPENAESARWLAAFRRERYKLSKLERRQREGTLISWVEVVKEWVARVVVVTSGLETFADRLAPLLAGKGREEIREVLRKEVRELRDQYARNGRYTPEVENGSKTS
jgi:transcriptional regulator with XRE-family HTH domain